MFLQGQIVAEYLKQMFSPIYSLNLIVEDP